MGALTVLFAGFGIWLLVEGALCALAPDLVRRIGARLSGLPARDLVIAGLCAATVGAILVTVAVRTA